MRSAIHPISGRKCQTQPRPGTKLRELYDHLRTGEVWHIGNTLSSYAMITQLQNFYGVETTGKTGTNGYIRMTGEWYGFEFVPIEKIMQEQHFSGDEE